VAILFVEMRRIVFLVTALAALAVPAAVLAAHQATGDGTLVIQRGSAPTDPQPMTPVVQLTKFNGTVLGQVKNWGKIIIDVGPSGDGAQVTGAGNAHTVAGTSAQSWSGTDFTFRATGQKVTVLIYGSNVNLFAVGSGLAQLAGTPDMTTGDGRYSLNGDLFKSLPGTPTKQLSIGSDG
jgi:hypothetical protein